MATDATIDTAIRKENLDLPEVPAVEQIEAEYYEDSTGVDSLLVWVILSDATKDEELTGEAVMQIKSAISESLLNSGVRLFPYIRIVTRSGYEEVYRRN